MRGAYQTSLVVAVTVAASLIGKVSCFAPSTPLRLDDANLNRRVLMDGRLQTSPRQWNGRNVASVSMHMGHSHSHQHSHASTVGTISIRPATIATSQQLQPQQQQQLPVWAKRRRISALLLFCAIAILGPPLARHRQLANSDIAAFVLTATSLFLLEPIRDQVKHILLRIRQLSDGISRHSSPISAKSIFKNDNAADRITLMGGAINVVLSLSKFCVGVSCHSSVLIADAGHSLSDLFSDFITLWAVNVGRLPPDADHPYGHAKFEAIGSLFLSLTLFATGIGVGAVSNKRLLEILSLQRSSSSSSTMLTATAIVLPKLPALLMAGISIVSKEWLFRVTRTVGERLNSQIVIANAWHHRSDAYSSVLALGSIALAMYVPGLVAVDAAAGLFVAGMICMTGAEIMGESIKQLTDMSNEDEVLVQRITALAANSEDVLKVNRVRARQVGSASTVDVSVSMQDDKSASAARAVELRLKQSIMQIDGIVDADVRATSPGVFCPLLEASNPLPMSTAEIESFVEHEILSSHPEVKSVEGVVVHYQDTLLVNVDVHIRLADKDTTLAQASKFATSVRDTIERSSQISMAKIFLDVNEDALASAI